MNKEDDPDLELLGTPPGVIAFFMILISFVAPIGIIPFNAWIVLGGGYGNPSLMIYSLIWFYTPDLYIPFSLMPLFFLINIWFTIPLTIFNLAYIRQVVHYYRGKCTRYSAIWIGMLSVTIPTLFTLAVTGLLTPGSFVFIGPIPIQFITGLIFLYKIPGPDMTSPWRGDLTDRHWWTPRRPEWWNRTFPSSKENEKEKSETDSKTERHETE